MTLGSVPYLNAQPLLHGLEARLAPPSQLAQWLRAGEVDAALVPVVEAMENPVYWLCDGVAIGCLGPVYSVFLALAKPLDEVRTAAMDPASKTSVQLARWILRGRDIEYVDPGRSADARLIIGDAAIEFRHRHPEVPLLDLGEAWREATGLPFVFAVWALRAPDAALAQRLRAAADAGLAERDALHLAGTWQHAYLTRHIRYELGDPQREALALFAKYLGLPWAPRWI